MKKIGMTGGVGSGKSKVLAFLQEEYGACIVMADEVGHEVMEAGTACYERIVETFGSAILDPDGRIFRPALASLVFSDEEARQKLNAIVHPAVHEEILRRMQAAEESGVRLFVLEAALLLESGYQDVLDEIWYVHTEKEVRIQRLMDSRGYSRVRAEEIMASQLSDEEFYKAADVVIENSGAWEETADAIRKHCQWKQW